MAHKGEDLDNSPESSGSSENLQKKNLPVSNRNRSRVPVYVVGSVIILSAIVGLFYWLYARQFETTDDAFVDGNIVQISSKISAHVTKIYVTENQSVKKGDLLIELDSREVENKLELAQAQLKSAYAQSEKAQANVSLTRKTNRAGVKQASSNFATAKNNVEQSKISADSKQTAIEQSNNQVKTAEANLKQAQSEIPD